MFDYRQIERGNKTLHAAHAKTKQDITDLARRHEALLDLRRPWDAAWKDLAAHFLPTRFRDVGQGQDETRNPKLLNDKLVDSTGVLAMRTMAAGLHGGMTSPARPWFRLTLEDPALADLHGVRDWMDEVATRMRAVFHRSNFYNAIHTVYAELGAFGTAYMMELADFQHGFRFLPFTAGEFCLETNARQQVDVVFRRFRMTARQLALQFGKDNLPDYIVSQVELTSRKEEQYTVVHAVYPRKDRDFARMDSVNKPWASVYWLDAGGSGGSQGTRFARPHVLSESGFDEFPGFGPRWEVTGNDVYGKSPAMDVLPDCRMLQQMGITTLKAIHKAVDPPLNVSAELKSVGLDITPGGLNYVSTSQGQAPQAATPIMQVRPEIQTARIAIQDVQRQIQQGLYNDLFRLLMGSDRRQVTAREIASREEEKLILIGPVLERLHDELFMPLIDRTFNLMARLDILPPPPPELTDAPIKVEFISLLAQAQKMVSTSAVDQLMAFTMNSAQAFPEVLDAVNIDKAVDNYAGYLGVEVDMLRPLQDREALRQQRAQAQAAAQQQAQQQAALQGMQGMAQTAQTLSQTPLQGGGETALDALTGGLGGMA